MYIRTREGLGQAITTKRSSLEYIRWVQQALNKILGFRLMVDGILGPQTRTAIRSFQQKQGLQADGVVGPKTEAALLKAASAAGPVMTIPAAATKPADAKRAPISAQGKALMKYCYQLKTACPALDDLFELRKHQCDAAVVPERRKLMCRAAALARYREQKERCRLVRQTCFPLHPLLREQREEVTL